LKLKSIAKKTKETFMKKPILFFLTVLFLSFTPSFPAGPLQPQGPDIEINQQLRQKAFMHLGIGLCAVVLSSVVIYNSIRWAADYDRDKHAVAAIGFGISIPVGISGVIFLISSSNLFSASRSVAEVKAIGP
jgi:hypothetical protein